MTAVLLTTVTLFAFAANSVLCRLALAEKSIDPIDFTIIRLGSAAIILAPCLLRPGWSARHLFKGAPSAVALFVYALGFSGAYVAMDAGTGALILFAAVQVTMIGAGIWRGDRPKSIAWLGVAAALGGLVYLVLPGLSAPPLWGSTWMAAAGVGWGVYSLLGKREADPIYATARNFMLTLAFAVPMAVVWMRFDDMEPRGMLLAGASGAVTSGMGYVIWYFALRHLTSMVAAVVQLAVPIIAAAGGVLFIAEEVTVRLLIAGCLILGGIFAVTWENQRRQPSSPQPPRTMAPRT